MSTAIRRAPAHRLAMVRRERLLRHACGATNAPLRVDDCQFALGFESANLRKNCRPPRRRSDTLPLLRLRSGFPQRAFTAAAIAGVPTFTLICFGFVSSRFGMCSVSAPF